MRQPALRPLVARHSVCRTKPLVRQSMGRPGSPRRLSNPTRNPLIFQVLTVCLRLFPRSSQPTFRCLSLLRRRYGPNWSSLIPASIQQKFTNASSRPAHTLVLAKRAHVDQLGISALAVGPEVSVPIDFKIRAAIRYARLPAWKRSAARWPIGFLYRLNSSSRPPTSRSLPQANKVRWCSTGTLPHSRFMLRVDVRNTDAACHRRWQTALPDCWDPD